MKERTLQKEGETPWMSLMERYSFKSKKKKVEFSVLQKIGQVKGQMRVKVISLNKNVECWVTILNSYITSIKSSDLEVSDQTL